MSTLSTDVAKKILERLVAEKVVLADDRRELLEKFAQGQVRAEDWKVAVEKGLLNTNESEQ